MREREREQARRRPSGLAEGSVVCSLKFQDHSVPGGMNLGIVCQTYILLRIGGRRGQVEYVSVVQVACQAGRNCDQGRDTRDTSSTALQASLRKGSAGVRIQRVGGDSKEKRSVRMEDY